MSWNADALSSADPDAESAASQGAISQELLPISSFVSPPVEKDILQQPRSPNLFSPDDGAEQETLPHSTIEQLSPAIQNSDYVVNQKQKKPGSGNSGTVAASEHASVEGKNKTAQAFAPKQLKNLSINQANGSIRTGAAKRLRAHIQKKAVVMQGSKVQLGVEEPRKKASAQLKKKWNNTTKSSILSKN